MNFSELPLENKLKNSIKFADFTTPTPIQTPSPTTPTPTFSDSRLGPQWPGLRSE